jgi:hypothetical protein
MRKLVLFFVLVFSVSGVLSAQTVIQLQDALNAGQVKLVSARGNGGSTGSAIDAELHNETRTELRINIHLSKPVYLVNGGAGQNMVAVEVYLSNGNYYSIGDDYFIELAPSAFTQVKFIAYCVDFEKENPSSGDSFEIKALPNKLKKIVQKISEYGIANPDTDYIIAAQLAIWMTQGVPVKSIKDKFTFTDEDEKLAHQLFGK